LLPSVRRAFDELVAGVERVREQCGSGTLTISATPSMGANWLASRLGRFQALHPEFEIRLSATQRLVDFAREGVDCGIRSGFGEWPGLRAERLFGAMSLMPVCSPALLDGPHPLRAPADLVHHTLLHALDDMEGWRHWLRAAGVSGVDPTRGLKFDSIPLVLQAAISGAGVAITRDEFVTEDLAIGRLVKPFDFGLPSDFAYYFVTPELTWDQPKLQAFREWLFAEAEAARRSEAGRDAPAPAAAD
jgi:LysR family glycine cleavage system transcriptional activator